MLFLVWGFAPVAALAAEPPPVSVRLGLLGAGEEVFDYEISVLKLALRHSSRPAELEVEVLSMPQERAFIELENGRASFNVFVSGFSADREARFGQIDVPLSRGLLGHRIFVTTEPNLKTLSTIQTLDELREWAVVGSGEGWPDTTIFEAAGFQVEKAQYENLWTMTAHSRINLFNRGIHEAYVEIGIRKPIYENLTVDPNLMVRYPFDYMFYVRQGDKELASLIEEGLLAAYESGAFMDHFYAHPMIRTVVEEANPAGRRIFDIPNPLMTDRQRAIPDTFWHRF
ncbi:hypothetical protein SAMN06265374_4342 [Roseibium denhamense]|uniref:Solute-binding protein family 3/N-terminal domain-containing protein n=1 Tax=Roseibium denhamense TaxID=76305 RepID=A0ABY1PMN3_9HYPH|nr:hypothetical protein SAMN06265374_4342 [Roseibium denhamense]